MKFDDSLLICKSDGLSYQLSRFLEVLIVSFFPTRYELTTGDGSDSQTKEYRY